MDVRNGRTIGLALALLGALAPPVQAQQSFCDQVEQIPKVECETLVTLFTSTGGPGWRIRYGWLRTIEPCFWFGISCTATEWPLRVTAIHLVDNNVSGQLPGALSRLTELRELVIQNRGLQREFGKLTGTIPLPFGQMEHLEVIWLSRNALSGPLPSDIARLPRLRILNLDGNEFDGPLPRDLEKVTTLEELNLSDNRLGGLLPDSLGGWASLRRLELARNTFSGALPAGMGGLDSLRVLDLRGNRFSGPIPESLGDLPRLFRLDLGDNAFTGPIPPNLAALPTLSILDLSGNRLSGPMADSTARRLAAIPFCTVEANDASLCAPRLDGIANQPVCGLPQSDTCLTATTSVVTAFEVTETETGARITWTIGAALTPARFELEQLDGDTPRLLATLTPEPGRRDFELDLEGLERGRYRFRLRVIGVDGSVAFGPAVDFVQVGGALLLEAWPNPASDVLRLRLSAAEKRSVRLALVDALGRTRATVAPLELFAGGSQTREIDVDGLAAGTYWLRATSEGMAPVLHAVVVR